MKGQGMIYFRDSSSEIFAYDQQQVDGGWVKEGLVVLTKKETEAHLAPKPPTADDIRAERDKRIQDVAWRFERYLSEMRLGIEPSDDISLLDIYVQALRDLPETQTDPFNITWPEPPNQ